MAGLVPAEVAGASMGSIVGALYCAGVSPDEMLKALKLPDFFTFPQWIGLKGGIGSLKVLEEQLNKFIPHNSFDKLKIPLVVSVTNLNTGRNELIRKGNLARAVMASSSIPIIFEPIKIGRHQYVDGGLTLNLPVSCLKKKGRFIVGVNSNRTSEVDTNFKTMRQVGERCLFIAVQNTLRDQIHDCHLLIEPPNGRHFTTFEFDKAQEIFEIGLEIGNAAAPQIRQAIGQ
jgi:NTE family protein